MKRVGIGALFVSLLAGSVAMAGQGYRGNVGNDRDHQRSDNRGHDDRGDTRHNDGRRNDRHDGNNHRGNDGHRNDGRNWNGNRNDHGRNDWNRGNDHRNQGRNNDRHDWNRDNGRRDWNGHGNNPRYGFTPAPRHYAPPRHYNSPRYYSPPRARFYYGSYHRPHGYYSHSWNRGERLPYAYYDQRYVVYDYDRCGLREPPYGYHWVRVNTDVVLAAVATGVILDVIYNQFY